MKFKCLKCGKHEFSVNVRDIVNEQIAVNFICPACGAQNQVSCDFTTPDRAQIELIEE
ncbi:MAG: hypothetical protein JJE21_10120 [Spirochaetaceae bacterium]|nr:hypothetical protein [Spirochaetaceae bacterium]